jgi:hypothetical protein
MLLPHHRAARGPPPLQEERRACSCAPAPGCRDLCPLSSFSTGVRGLERLGIRDRFTSTPKGRRGGNEAEDPAAGRPRRSRTCRGRKPDAGTTSTDRSAGAEAPRAMRLRPAAAERGVRPRKGAADGIGPRASARGRHRKAVKRQASRRRPPNCRPEVEAACRFFGRVRAARRAPARAAARSGTARAPARMGPR